MDWPAFDDYLDTVDALSLNAGRHITQLKELDVPMEEAGERIESALSDFMDRFTSFSVPELVERMRQLSRMIKEMKHWGEERALQAGEALEALDHKLRRLDEMYNKFEPEPSPEDERPLSSKKNSQRKAAYTPHQMPTLTRKEDLSNGNLALSFGSSMNQRPFWEKPRTGDFAAAADGTAATRITVSVHTREEQPREASASRATAERKDAKDKDTAHSERSTRPSRPKRATAPVNYAITTIISDCPSPPSNGRKRAAGMVGASSHEKSTEKSSDASAGRKMKRAKTSEYCTCKQDTDDNMIECSSKANGFILPVLESKKLFVETGFVPAVVKRIRYTKITLTISPLFVKYTPILNPQLPGKINRT
ncbi:hypothetical protein HK104_004150 [Borealophlyctis nickersoniae]|nr:hypothetical protein HK104_004150 [Borealophlyctis nickersoniae]